MAAFNAVAGLNPFTIIAVAIAAVDQLLTFLQVSSICPDRHGILSRQYGAQQLAGSAGVQAIGQVISGFVSEL